MVARTGIEEGGHGEAMVKKCPVDTFLARGRFHSLPTAAGRLLAEANNRRQFVLLQKQEDLFFMVARTGIEEGGHGEAMVKKCPVDTFLARGRF